MASPFDSGRLATAFTSLATWNVPMPSGIVANDLLICYFRTATAVDLNTMPSGWQILGGWVDPDATDDRHLILYRRSTGSGDSLSIALTSASKGAAIVWRISGAADPAVQLPQVSASVAYTAANGANSPAISPVGGSKEFLFLTCIGYGGPTTTGFTVPSGYTTLVGTASTGASGATNCGIMGGSRQATTATEDPAAWVNPAPTGGGCAFTIAIYPAPPAGPQTYFGATALTVTFGRVVAGRRTSFGQIIRPFTFSAFVNGDVVAPAVTHYSNLVMPMAFGATIAGRRKTFGKLTLLITFDKTVQAQRKTFAKTNAPFIFGKAVAATRTTFGQTAFPITFGIATSGIRVGLRHYGVVALPITFDKDVKGQRKAFGQVALPITFLKDVRGQRKTFGRLDLPLLFGEDVSGRNHLYGMLSMQTLFGKEVAGRRKTFGQVALPLIFSKDVRGLRKTFGRVALPINVTIVTNAYARARQYGQLSLPIVFDKQTAAQRKTFGQVTAPFFLGSATQGQRRAFSRIDFPMELLLAIEEVHLGIHGEVSLPIIVTFETLGYAKSKGVILNLADMIYLGTTPVLAIYVEDQKVWPMT